MSDQPFPQSGANAAAQTWEKYCSEAWDHGPRSDKFCNTYTGPRYDNIPSLCPEGSSVDFVQGCKGCPGNGFCGFNADACTSQITEPSCERLFTCEWDGKACTTADKTGTGAICGEGCFSDAECAKQNVNPCSIPSWCSDPEKRADHIRDAVCNNTYGPHPQHNVDAVTSHVCGNVGDP